MDVLSTSLAVEGMSVGRISRLVVWTCSRSQYPNAGPAAMRVMIFPLFCLGCYLKTEWILPHPTKLFIPTPFDNSFSLASLLCYICDISKVTWYSPLCLNHFVTERYLNRSPLGFHGISSEAYFSLPSSGNPSSTRQMVCPKQIWGDPLVSPRDVHDRTQPALVRLEDNTVLLKTSLSS